MTKIPQAKKVRQSLRAVKAAAKNARKGLNNLASERMSRGDYAGAETLVARGKEIIRFESEVDLLIERWGDLSGGGNRREAKAVTPLWNYYQPILRALVQLGGVARVRDLETAIEPLLSSALLPQDRSPMASGRERWQVMVQRACKPMVAEGWLEGKGPVWRITQSGRQAAQRPMEASKSILAGGR
jgi:hypothetical protein